MSRNIISILDLDELLQKTVDIICEEFGFYYAGVFLLAEDGEWAVLQAGRGDAGAAMLAEGHKLRVGGLSMIGASTSRRTALIALDVGDEPVHFKNPHLPLTRSEMALPLAVGDEVIGALTVQSVEEAAFSEDDITALQAMADQLAIAIHNAKTYSEKERVLAQARRRARLLEAASEVGRGVTSILDLDELFQRTVDIICDAYGFYYAGIFLLSEDREWAVLVAGRGEAGRRMVNEGHKLRIGGLSMIGTSIAERQARIALDVGDEPVHFKNPHLPLTRSEMALPLTVGERVIGSVTVQSTAEAAFSDEDINSLQAMADQLAIAIHNARLLRELEAAHAELVRTKTFEAIATATTEAIHWIGNKALPITVSVRRLREDLTDLPGAPEAQVESMIEDLSLIEDSALLIVDVQERLIGPAREFKPAPAMVQDVFKDTAVMMGIPEGVLSHDVAPNLPLGIVDTTQLGRAFRYVLQNALEATADVEQPRINVRLFPKEERGVLYVVARISDNGPGISAAAMDKMWASFFTTKGSKHAGLGLSAALQILKQVDGKIDAHNLPEGGAAFDLYLPAAGSPPKPTSALPSGKSFLLVDDEDAWSHFAEELLTQSGNTLARVSDGKADFSAFDVIIVDDILEEADSLNVLRRIAEAGAAEKTITVTSNLRVERTMAVMQVGMDELKPKPYTRAAFVDLLA